MTALPTTPYPTFSWIINKYFEQPRKMASSTATRKGAKGLGGTLRGPGGRAEAAVNSSIEGMHTEIKSIQKFDHQQPVNVSLRIAGLRKEEPTTYGDNLQLLLCGQ
eukprot:GHVS01068425.1.p3 GENE.GHVS01068425.1~~GHVS01068425.1.p3  ORF type:complete len:106 (-),score=7.71 GHVS01068425.1:405-722(-)